MRLRNKTHQSQVAFLWVTVEFSRQPIIKNAGLTVWAFLVTASAQLGAFRLYFLMETANLEGHLNFGSILLRIRNAPSI